MYKIFVMYVFRHNFLVSDPGNTGGEKFCDEKSSNTFDDSYLIIMIFYGF